jgi:hypothetical protein
LGKIIVFAMWFICRSKFTHIVNAAQFSHFCIEDFQKKKKPQKKKRKKSHLRILRQFGTLVHTNPFWITRNAVDQRVFGWNSVQAAHWNTCNVIKGQCVWMKFSSHGPLKHIQNVIIPSWVKFVWTKLSSHCQSHHGWKFLDETQFTLGNPIMDESVWMKLSSHWAMSSWVENFGWNSVHTGQCHHGSMCLDETQFHTGQCHHGS